MTILILQLLGSLLPFLLEYFNEHRRAKPDKDESLDDALTGASDINLFLDNRLREIQSNKRGSNSGASESKPKV